MFSTDKGNQLFLPDWVIWGDNSRSVFFHWLLSGTRLKTHEGSVIWIRYGAKVSVKEKESQWIIKTPTLLPKTTLCLPPTDSFDFSIDTSKLTRHAVLEEFPFRKQSSIDLIQHLEGCGCETLVVLMDLPRHQGSTDLIAPGEDLNQAMAMYRNERRDVSVMRDAGNLHSVLHWHRPIYDVWVNKARNYLAEIGERIDEVPYDYPLIEEDWKDDHGPLQEKTMDSVLSYKEVKGMKENNLWDRYVTASKRFLFPAVRYSPLLPVVELYRDCLDNPLVFWSVDEDARDFMDVLRSTFDIVLESEEAKEDYRNKTLLQKELNECEYYSVVAKSRGNGTALNAVFRKVITNFLCNDVKNYLQERLKQRYQKLEAMIK